MSDAVDSRAGSSFLMRMQSLVQEKAGNTALGAHPWDLVDFPMYWNCGDSAIWMGELALARSMRQRVRRVHDRRTYRPEALKPDSVIAYTGGGTWGGLYPSHHRLRLRVLDDTRGRPLVQLPMSIEYADAAHREALRRAVDAHGAVVLMTRDQRSYEVAIKDYACPVLLVPDVAFALGGLQRHSATIETKIQRRTDKEAAPSETLEPTFDWLSPPPRSASRAWLRVAECLAKTQSRLPAGAVSALVSASTTCLARANMRRGQSLLSSGRTVVTDRLHGHVMSTLMRIPHIVVNDKYGKVAALYDTWTHVDPISHLSQSWDDVEVDLAKLREVAA